MSPEHSGTLRPVHALVDVTTVLALTSGGTDESISVSDDALPWEWILVGGPVLLLATLVALALYRLRQRHR
jgi:hypothetical protein